MSTWTPPFGSALFTSWRVPACESLARVYRGSLGGRALAVCDGPVSRSGTRDGATRSHRRTGTSRPSSCPSTHPRGARPSAGGRERAWKVCPCASSSEPPSAKDRAGRRGCQPPHVPFRVASFSHGAPPRRDETSTHREAFHLHAAACWFHPFQRRLGQRGQRICSRRLRP